MSIHWQPYLYMYQNPSFEEEINFLLSLLGALCRVVGLRGACILLQKFRRSKTKKMDDRRISRFVKDLKRGKKLVNVDGAQFWSYSDRGLLSDDREKRWVE